MLYEEEGMNSITEFCDRLHLNKKERIAVYLLTVTFFIGWIVGGGLLVGPILIDTWEGVTIWLQVAIALHVFIIDFILLLCMFKKIQRSARERMGLTEWNLRALDRLESRVEILEGRIRELENKEK